MVGQTTRGARVARQRRGGPAVEVSTKIRVSLDIMIVRSINDTDRHNFATFH